VVARFTVLTDRLIRLEFHRDGRFEDRASQAFWFREQPVPEFRAE
jgi:alpha-glucosidase